LHGRRVVLGTVIRIGVLGVALSVGFLAVEPAKGYVGVYKVIPREGIPDEPVELLVGCGWCASSSIGGRIRPPAAFPVSLVPVARAPHDQTCPAWIIARLETKLPKAAAEKAECPQEAAEPPPHRPYVFLGKAKPVFDLDHPPEDSWATNYRLRFQIPKVRPGPYAFVIFGGNPGHRGSLIANNPTRYLLHVRRADSGASAATGTGTSIGKDWWIAAGGALLLLAGGAVLLQRRLVP
jgi:hypothetical protein